jgi:aspartate/methionine/tyrosine aminotransferase
MEIDTFQLERYFARHEFSARYLLSSSDCEPLSLTELLALADEKTLDMWNELKLGYTESWGHPLLREEIGGMYGGISPEDVLTVVPEEGIFLFMHALLEPGDHVVCTYPGYQSLYEVARSIGCRVSTWAPDEEMGWKFDIEDLKGLLESKTRLVVVNFPHNPTGYRPPAEDFDKLIDMLRMRGIYLLSDEMYRYLELDEGTTLPSACEVYDRACSLSGLSKTFGLPGLRVGWLVSLDHGVLNQVSRLKDYTTICGSAPSEILAIVALQSRTEIIRQQLARVRRNVGLLDRFFDGFQDRFQWQRPRGGSVCFPRMLGDKGTYEFCERIVQEAGIMLVPSREFQYGDHHVRIGFGRENLPEVLEKFANYLGR